MDIILPYLAAFFLVMGSFGIMVIIPTGMVAKWRNYQPISPRRIFLLYIAKRWKLALFCFLLILFNGMLGSLLFLTGG